MNMKKVDSCFFLICYEELLIYINDKKKLRKCIYWLLEIKKKRERLKGDYFLILLIIIFKDVIFLFLRNNEF